MNDYISLIVKMLEKMTDEQLKVVYYYIKSIKH